MKCGQHMTLILFNVFSYMNFIFMMHNIFCPSAPILRTTTLASLGFHTPSNCFPLKKLYQEFHFLSVTTCNLKTLAFWYTIRKRGFLTLELGDILIIQIYKHQPKTKSKTNKKKKSTKTINKMYYGVSVDKIALQKILIIRKDIIELSLNQHAINCLLW